MKFKRISSTCRIKIKENILKQMRSKSLYVIFSLHNFNLQKVLNLPSIIKGSKRTYGMQEFAWKGIWDLE